MTAASFNCRRSLELLGVPGLFMLLISVLMLSLLPPGAEAGWGINGRVQDGLFTGDAELYEPCGSKVVGYAKLEGTAIGPPDGYFAGQLLLLV
jgi:hypothetical protein